jgi:serine/threonine protein kinase
MTDFDTKLHDLFDQAMQIATEEQESFVDAVREEDSELAHELGRLLQYDQDLPDVFLKGRPADEAALQVNHIPERIGRYRVLREIGRGGMGIVYEAEQEDPKRRVALKIIRQELGLGQRMRRFRQEAHVLGKLQHPGIAQIFEAGTAGVGHSEPPFFAMELVEGVPLDEACRSLSTTQKLQLMVRICDAVEHAHQKGIIHRDLKPANILVVRPANAANDTVERTGTVSAATNSEGARDATTSQARGTSTVDTIGQPKILDFGIARMTDADMQTVTQQTDVGQLLGTVPYMSPEQVSGDSEKLDTRSDVYSLGVILFQMLCGRLPLELGGLSMLEAIRRIQEVEPVNLGTLHSESRGDLEAIVGKALEKELHRRYQSAGALAADLRRNLACEPVEARPTSAIYQMRKFARRNKAIVAGLTSAFVALFIGFGVAMYSYMQASRERDEKIVALENEKAAREEANEINGFYAQMLLASGRDRGGGSITVREVLDNAAMNVGKAFKDRPNVSQLMQMVIGKTYMSLGAHEQAVQQFEHLIEHVEEVGEKSIKSWEAHNARSACLLAMGRFDQAEAAFRTAIDSLPPDMPPNDPRIAKILCNLGIMISKMGRSEESIEHLIKAIDIFEQQPNPDISMIIKSKIELLNQYSQKNSDAFDSMLPDLLERSRSHFGPEHPYTVRIIETQILTRAKKDPKNALSSFQELLELQMRALGEIHPSTLATVLNVVRAMDKAGRPEEAIPLLQDSLERARAELGDDHNAVHQLGTALDSMKAKANSVRARQGNDSESDSALKKPAVPDIPPT